MLITDNRHEAPFTFRTLGTNLRMWRAVTLELHVSYFLVRFAMKEGQSWVGQTSLLWNVDDLVDFCSTGGNDPFQRILQVGLLCPPAGDNASDWRMENISEIWKGQTEIVVFDESGNELKMRGSVPRKTDIELVKKIFPVSK